MYLLGQIEEQYKVKNSAAINNSIEQNSRIKAKSLQCTFLNRVLLGVANV